jgi:cell shape-determining protein MreC
MNLLRILAVSFLIVVLLLLVIFFKQNVFLFFENLRLAFWGTINPDFSYRNLLAFKLNHLSSSSEVLSLSNLNNSHLLPVKIYSNYPFNDYGSIVLASGEKNGLKVGMPVLVSSTTILGVITKVNQNTALVMTIFNSQWKSSIFLGEQKINGLLEGGINPEINYVDKNASTSPNLVVYNADSRFPLNLIFGQTGQFETKNIWQKAPLNFFYDLASLREVFVLLNFQ